MTGASFLSQMTAQQSAPGAAAAGMTDGVQASLHTAGERALADHFLDCCRMGRYLTVADGHRFVITDDFKATQLPPDATALAAIFSKDKLVAQAAILPLSGGAKKVRGRNRAKFERLFELIEQQALDPRVQQSASHLLERGFREAEIKAIEADLGDQMSPARQRYRTFLDVVRRLMDGQVSPGAFHEEFKSFTAEVAGKLDFGIYSFCLDRLFGSMRIPMVVKQMLVGELITFPPLVRRELLSNILAFPGQAEELRRHVKSVIVTELGQSVAVEIELLEAFKQRRLTPQDLTGAFS